MGAFSRHPRDWLRLLRHGPWLVAGTLSRTRALSFYFSGYVCKIVRSTDGDYPCLYSTGRVQTRAGDEAHNTVGKRIRGDQPSSMSTARVFAVCLYAAFRPRRPLTSR